MRKIKLGEGCKLNLERLIETRALIQANSGGGKSYMLRKFLEETHGKVQQIVLDLEGEFSTLREKYDYLLVGKDGDIKLDIRSAELLAKKILEMNVSVIIDLYELKHQERIHFVRVFLDALINAPKELWHPCLVIVDEAHQFAPEKGESEALGSVCDLMTRGRKRGLCGVLATQRLSKLHKDAAAEANNKFMGRTGLDVDMKRVGEELGFTKKSDMLSLRELEPGEFYTFGPALSNQVKKIRIGTVQTSHPKAGYKIMTSVTPPTAAIKKMLNKLADLPQQAEEELKTKDDMMKKIRELKSELRQKPAPKIDENKTKIIVENATKKAYSDAERQYSVQFNKLKAGIPNLERQYNDNIRKMKLLLSNAENKLAKISQMLGKDYKPTSVDLTIHDESSKLDMKRVSVPKIEPPGKMLIASTRFQERFVPKPIERSEPIEGALDRCSRMIYTFLANHPEKNFRKKVIGAMIGYSQNSSGFVNSVSKLHNMGLITRAGEFLQAKEIREDLIGEEKFEISMWASKLDRCSREIFRVVSENPDNDFSKEEVAEQTTQPNGQPYSVGSSGFVNAISTLVGLGLISRMDGRIKLNEEVRDMI